MKNFGHDAICIALGYMFGVAVTLIFISNGLFPGVCK